jgi:hypothetical protein
MVTAVRHAVWRRWYCTADQRGFTLMTEFERGFAQAIEAAARIVDRSPHFDGHIIAQAIRALAPPEQEPSGAATAEPTRQVSTDDMLGKLQSDGMMGADLSPGNPTSKWAHEEIVRLQSALSAQSTLVREMTTALEPLKLGEAAPFESRRLRAAGCEETETLIGELVELNKRALGFSPDILNRAIVALSTQSALVRELREALEPFARYAEFLANSAIPSACPLSTNPTAIDVHVTVGDLRRAQEDGSK